MPGARLKMKDAAAFPEFEEAVAMAEKLLPTEEPQLKEARDALGARKAALAKVPAARGRGERRHSGRMPDEPSRSTSEGSDSERTRGTPPGADGPPPRTTPRTPAAALPALIGSYSITRILGQGGMGTVYEAQQESPSRTVALKVIRAGYLSQELLRRFKQESQVLGRLQHPGIAQV